MDWSAPAELYAGIASFRTRNSRYRRFASVAEAIRFAIEETPRAELRGLAIECGEERHEGEAIRALYQAADYPLQRETR